ncbi:hypothetical protein DFH09DRAFT_1080923 [Mycena vulgaris]|nr:hypothetical protein DFH09DRAFT_1080923 [Mycena vulgaris]
MSAMQEAVADHYLDELNAQSAGGTPVQPRSQPAARTRLDTLPIALVAIFCGSPQPFTAAHFHELHPLPSNLSLGIDDTSTEVRPQKPLRSSGCGAQIHSTAAPKLSHNLWAADVVGVATTVIPLEAQYVSTEMAASMFVPAMDCGCCFAFVGCAVCGNALGGLFTPCSAHFSVDFPSVYSFSPSAVSPPFPNGHTSMPAISRGQSALPPPIPDSLLARRLSTLDPANPPLEHGPYLGTVLNSIPDFNFVPLPSRDDDRGSVGRPVRPVRRRERYPTLPPHPSGDEPRVPRQPPPLGPRDPLAEPAVRRFIMSQAPDTLAQSLGARNPLDAPAVHVYLEAVARFPPPQEPRVPRQPPPLPHDTLPSPAVRTYFNAIAARQPPPHDPQVPRQPPPLPRAALPDFLRPSALDAQSTPDFLRSAALSLAGLQESQRAAEQSLAALRDVHRRLLESGPGILPPETLTRPLPPSVAISGAQLEVSGTSAALPPGATTRVLRVGAQQPEFYQRQLDAMRARGGPRPPGETGTH